MQKIAEAPSSAGELAPAQATGTGIESPNFVAFNNTLYFYDNDTVKVHMLGTNKSFFMRHTHAIAQVRNRREVEEQRECEEKASRECED